MLDQTNLLIIPSAKLFYIIRSNDKNLHTIIKPKLENLTISNNAGFSVK